MSKKLRWALGAVPVVAVCALVLALFVRWQLSHMHVGFFTPANVKTIITAAEAARVVVFANKPGLELPDAVVMDIVSSLKKLGPPCEQNATPNYVRESVPKNGVRRHRLGPEGPQALIVRLDPPRDNACSCGASGNCLTRIYEAQGNSYKQVFDGTTQELVFLPTVHDERFDIRTFEHFASDQAWVTQYRWDGSKYAQSATFCAIGYGDFAARRFVPGQCPGH